MNTTEAIERSARVQGLSKKRQWRARIAYWLCDCFGVEVQAVLPTGPGCPERHYPATIPQVPVWSSDGRILSNLSPLTSDELVAIEERWKAKRIFQCGSLTAALPVEDLSDSGKLALVDVPRLLLALNHKPKAAA